MDNGKITKQSKTKKKQIKISEQTTTIEPNKTQKLSINQLNTTGDQTLDILTKNPAIQWKKSNRFTNRVDRHHNRYSTWKYNNTPIQQYATLPQSSRTHENFYKILDFSNPTSSSHQSKLPTPPHSTTVEKQNILKKDYLSNRTQKDKTSIKNLKEANNNEFDLSKLGKRLENTVGQRKEKKRCYVEEDGSKESSGCSIVKNNTSRMSNSSEGNSCPSSSVSIGSHPVRGLAIVQSKVKNMDKSNLKFVYISKGDSKHSKEKINNDVEESDSFSSRNSQKESQLDECRSCEVLKQRINEYEHLIQSKELSLEQHEKKLMKMQKELQEKDIVISDFLNFLRSN